MARKRKMKSRKPRAIKRRPARRVRRKRRSAPVATVQRKRRSTRRRSRRSVRRTVRNAKRRFTRRSNGSGGGFNLKSLTSRDTLMLAGGAIASGVLTSYAMKFTASKGIQLPMGNTPVGQIAWRLAIPVAGAYAVNKFLKQPTLAKGIMLGGVIAAIQGAIELSKSATGATAGTGLYLNAGMNAYLSPGMPSTNGMSGMPGGNMSAVEQFGGLLDSESAFSDNAWN